MLVPEDNSDINDANSTPSHLFSSQNLNLFKRRSNNDLNQFVTSNLPNNQNNHRMIIDFDSNNPDKELVYQQQQ